MRKAQISFNCRLVSSVTRHGNYIIIVKETNILQPSDEGKDIGENGTMAHQEQTKSTTLNTYVTMHE